MIAQKCFWTARPQNEARHHLYHHNLLPTSILQFSTFSSIAAVAWVGVRSLSAWARLLSPCPMDLCRCQHSDQINDDTTSSAFDSPQLFCYRVRAGGPAALQNRAHHCCAKKAFCFPVSGSCFCLNGFFLQHFQATDLTAPWQMSPFPADSFSQTILPKFWGGIKDLVVKTKTPIICSLAPPPPSSVLSPLFNNQFLWLLAKLHGTKQLLAWLSQREELSIYLKNANTAPIKINPASVADENCGKDVLWYDGVEIKADMNMRSHTF